MDRRKTILIAVLVNAGLLALLFVMFLYREEEVPARAELTELVPQESRPLFNDTAPPLVIAPPLPEPQPVILAPPAEEIVHQLPPSVPQETLVVQAPAAAPAPAAALNEITVKKGDSLEKIAKAHRTSVDEIIRLNQLPSSFLRVGQTLKLPAERAAAANAKPVEKRSQETAAEYYTVKVGDNPWTIAMKHHMKVEELLKLNNLNEERARRLKVGDKLRIR